MKKLLALLLALAMIFALAACGESNTKDRDKDKDKDDEKVTQGTTTVPQGNQPTQPAPGTNVPATTIVGSWRYEMPMTGEAMGYTGVDTAIALEFTQTYKADGTMTMVVNEDKLMASMPAFEAALVDWMVENMYYGDDSVRDALADAIAQQNLGQTLVDQYNSVSATYTVEGNTLTVISYIDADMDIPEEVYTFAFVGNTVELYAANDATQEAFETNGIDKLVLYPA